MRLHRDIYRDSHQKGINKKMKLIRITLLLFIFFSIQLSAQNISKGFKYIEEHSYDKALSIFTKSPQLSKIQQANLLALQESKMIIEGSILNENQIFISTGSDIKKYLFAIGSRILLLIDSRASQVTTPSCLLNPVFNTNSFIVSGRLIAIKIRCICIFYFLMQKIRL